MASVLIMLDKTTIHGGCILFVPGSHKWGVLDHQSDEKTTNYKQWCVTKSALQERIPDDSVLRFGRGRAGRRGSSLIAISYTGRDTTCRPPLARPLIYACADLSNQPTGVDNPRPDWVVDRQFEPITNECVL